jgi:hypothetical protein
MRGEGSRNLHGIRPSSSTATGARGQSGDDALIDRSKSRAPYRSRVATNGHEYARRLTGPSISQPISSLEGPRMGEREHSPSGSPWDRWVEPVREDVDTAKPDSHLASSRPDASRQELPLYPLYVRPEYDPTYQGSRSTTKRPGKDRAARPRARFLVYLLVALLLTCGGAVVGGLLSLSYLQQALPQMYSRSFPGTAIATTPATPETPAIPDAPALLPEPSVTAVPTISIPISPPVEQPIEAHPGTPGPGGEHCRPDSEPEGGHR